MLVIFPVHSIVVRTADKNAAVKCEGILYVQTEKNIHVASSTP